MGRRRPKKRKPVKSARRKGRYVSSSKRRRKLSKRDRAYNTRLNKAFDAIDRELDLEFAIKRSAHGTVIRRGKKRFMVVVHRGRKNVVPLRRRRK